MQARAALRFMLHALQCTQNTKMVLGCHVAQGMKRPPEVLTGDCPESKRKAGVCKYVGPQHDPSPSHHAPSIVTACARQHGQFLF